MTRFLTATRERFLVAIVEQVPDDRIAEIHFFPPMTQGGIESGVAVIAATLSDGATEVGTGSGHATPEEAQGKILPEAGATEESRPDSTPASEADDASDESLADTSDEGPPRFTVFTARYRLVLKGPDRGSWDVSLVEEADAPLLTVERVARGVQHRAGDVDAPERYDGTELRGFVDRVRARGEGRQTEGRQTEGRQTEGRQTEGRQTEGR